MWFINTAKWSTNVLVDLKFPLNAVSSVHNLHTATSLPLFSDTMRKKFSNKYLTPGVFSSTLDAFSFSCSVGAATICNWVDRSFCCAYACSFLYLVYSSTWNTAKCRTIFDMHFGCTVNALGQNRQTASTRLPCSATIRKQLSNKIRWPDDVILIRSLFSLNKSTSLFCASSAVYFWNSPPWNSWFQTNQLVFQSNLKFVAILVGWKNLKNWEFKKSLFFEKINTCKWPINDNKAPASPLTILVSVQSLHAADILLSISVMIRKYFENKIWFSNDVGLFSNDSCGGCGFLLSCSINFL